MTTARQALLAALCLLTALGAYLLTPRQMLADLEPVNLEQMVPKQFGDWKALPQHDGVITSPEQEAFKIRVNKQGYASCVCRNVKDAIDFVSIYMAQKVKRCHVCGKSGTR